MKKSTVFLKAVFWTWFGYYIFHYIRLKDSLQKEQKQTQKLDHLLKLANQIIIESSNGKPIHKKIEEQNISSAAIYGMSQIGERVMEDILLNSSINLLYGIDKRAGEMKMPIPVYTLEKAAKMEKPDSIILTTLTEDDGLKKEIEEKMSCKVITIGELLYE